MLTEQDILQIRKFSDVTGVHDLSVGEACYRLGCIQGIILSSNNKTEYMLYTSKDIPAETKQQIKDAMEDNKPNVISESFAEKAVKELEKRDMIPNKDVDASLIISLLGRSADRANLKEEIKKRWSNKNYAAQISKHLLSDNINTMTDFMLYFDNPEHFHRLEVGSLVAQGDDETGFHYSHYSTSDLNKFKLLYLALNDGKIGLKAATYEDVLRNFLNIPEKMRSARYINALRSNYSIYTLNQLCYFVEHKGIEELKKGQFLGNVPDSIYKINDKRYAKEEN